MRSLQEEQLFDIIIIPNICSSVNHKKENSLRVLFSDEMVNFRKAIRKSYRGNKFSE